LGNPGFLLAQVFLLAQRFWVAQAFNACDWKA